MRPRPVAAAVNERSRLGARVALGAVMTGALLAGFASAIAGCPGVTPHEGFGGSGGASARASSSRVSSSGIVVTGTMSSSSGAGGATPLTSSSASSSSSGCGVCAPATPANPVDMWSGPTVVYVGAGTPACPDLVGAALDGGLDDAAFVGTPAQCDLCLCSHGVSDCTIHVKGYLGPGCMTQQMCGGVVVDDTCNAIVPPDAGAVCATDGGQLSFSVTADDPQPTACTASPRMAPPPPHAWETNVVVCNAPSSKSCGEDGARVCLPSAGGAARDAGSSFDVCIYTPGDVSCPPLGYPRKITMWANYADTRSCTDCTCGAPTGSCEGGVVRISPASDKCVTTGSIVVDVPTTCTSHVVDAGAVISAVVIDASTVTPTCAPDGGEPDGSTSADIFTVCCAL